MAGYNNNHLRFGERCCIQIFYRSRQREGGQENMCYRNFPLEMRVRGEGHLLWRIRSVARSSLLSLYASESFFEEIWVCRARGRVAASNWLFTKLYELLTPINQLLSKLEHSRFQIHMIPLSLSHTTRVTLTTNIALKTRSPLLLG